MTFIREFTKGIGLFFSSIGFIFENRLGKYLLFPLVIWILVFTASFFFIQESSNYVSSYFDLLVAKINLPDSLESVQAFITKYLGSILSFIAKIFMWWITGTLIKYFSLILLSPVLALLSEAVEEKITGKLYPFKLNQFLKDILRGVIFVFRNMLIEFSLIFVGWIICLVIPIAWIIVTPALFFIGWYFMGLSMMDYSCERHKMSINESLRFLRKHKGILCGIGLCYSFFLSINNPFSTFNSFWIIFIIFKIVAGILFFCFVPILGSAAATRWFVQIKTNEEKV